MKVAFVSPSFWSGKRKDFYKPGDQIYDHPLPLEEKGTLVRCIKSMKKLKDKDFTFILISAATRPEVENEVDRKIRSLIEETRTKFDIRVFGYRELRRFKRYLQKKGKKSLLSPLHMYGYAGIRNMCLLAAHILGVDIAISIDDDVVFEDPNYMKKAKEFIGKKKGQDRPLAIYGPYQYGKSAPDWEKIETPVWRTYWDNVAPARKAWEKFILSKGRLKETSYVVMSNIVVHKDFFTKVPLDPNINRGEDMDWVVNALMFGYKFFVDNKLRVRHLPPPRTHPAWRLTGEDIKRYIYARAKVRSLEKHKGIPKEYFDPFPGEFLKDDLEERIFKTNIMLAMESLVNKDFEGAKGCLENIHLAKYKARPKFDPYVHMVKFQGVWEKLMNYVEKHRDELQKLIFKS
ncbi:hypothetical protein L6386_03200 [bacterium]|nr:hypothetical protein [bacterium]MCG2677550.1 hypothetical protein [bacterium]